MSTVQNYGIIIKNISRNTVRKIIIEVHREIPAKFIKLRRTVCEFLNQSNGLVAFFLKQAHIIGSEANENKKITG